MNADLRKTYTGKRVFITGHTGFKGSWLSLWLTTLGAEVYGYALDPPTSPSLFKLLKLEKELHHQVADVRDKEKLTKAIARIKPDIIFHLAAQAVVRESYETPFETIETNVTGTMNVMEAVRNSGIATAMVMITSDKCYENKEWLYGYRENDSLGGYDPYSASKAAAEVLISCWRNSFFHPERLNEHGVRLASARAGNVIGGGDWTRDHILTDCIRALQNHEPIRIRNPYATRPWQHALDPLSGYLQLGAKLLESGEDVSRYCEAFNFGPQGTSNKSVLELVHKIIACWGDGTWIVSQPEKIYHESSLLNLSIDKSRAVLGWSPQWNFEKAVVNTVAWYKALQNEPSGILPFTIGQVQEYELTDDVLLEPVEPAEMRE
jgi:CDP-glucose 4,6-dehydratase